MSLSKSEFDSVAEGCREILGFDRVVTMGVFTANLESGNVGESPHMGELRYYPTDESLRFTYYYPEKEDVSEEFDSKEDLYEFVRKTDF